MTKYTTVIHSPDCTSMYFTEDLEVAELLEHKIRNEHVVLDTCCIGQIGGDKYTVIFDIKG